MVLVPFVWHKRALSHYGCGTDVLSLCNDVSLCTSGIAVLDMVRYGVLADRCRVLHRCVGCLRCSAALGVALPLLEPGPRPLLLCRGACRDLLSRWDRPVIRGLSQGLAFSSSWTDVVRRVQLLSEVERQFFPVRGARQPLCGLSPRCSRQVGL